MILKMTYHKSHIRGAYDFHEQYGRGFSIDLEKMIFWMNPFKTGTILFIQMKFVFYQLHLIMMVSKVTKN